MWEHQNEHFVRDFLQFSHFVASKSMFSYEFSLEPENLLPQKSAAPATQNDDGRVQSAAPAMKSATHLAKTSQKYCAHHTKRHSTHYKTRLNVTKCHTCHVKRSNPTFETSKNDPFCRTYYRHGHTGIAQTVADGCRRLRMVADGWATTSEHTLNPQTPRVKREPLLRIREKLTNLWILAIETASSETFRS